MVIDTDTYKLSNKNYYNVEYTKKQIVVGHTGRKDMYHYSSWINRHNGKYKKSAAYTIDREGNIDQHYDPKFYSEFISMYDMGPFTIPITLSNVGWVQKDNINDRYYDWLGHNYILDDDDIVNKKWRNKEYWVKYTDKQLKHRFFSLIRLL